MEDMVVVVRPSPQYSCLKENSRKRSTCQRYPLQNYKVLSHKQFRLTHHPKMIIVIIKTRI